MPENLARRILDQPAWTRPSYRALSAYDGPVPPGFVVTAAIPTSADIRVAASNYGVRYVVAFMNQTARYLADFTDDPTGTEVAVLPGAVFAAAGSLRPPGLDFDVLIAVEMLREPGPEPEWPAENHLIEQMILDDLASTEPFVKRDCARFSGPIDVEVPDFVD
ncbi:hypothetical protein CLV28_0985 [Sediminihabitans luteus]|uniref:Uncharacterized protein n=1 Tax=Sediminihabitans luteus TaxID=1138585 RepID=A0A2M9D0R8_9CELL|nr:hypothetical protein [Sediminihabitans luteus]PJJ77759.1 hypothetical protein CLV28_0985 [Sediminihabitans luteus]GIJ00014.1 hypothetical protein Slu03_23910 [Sediminihabitans luteus]